MPARFRNRTEAGQVLATKLSRYAGMPGAIVLALPRGGVPVGYEVAVALGLPLDVLVVRKLGVPGHEELAMGAIAGSFTVVNGEVVDALKIPAIAPMASSSWPGTPSFRTTSTSSGRPRATATS